MGNHKTTIMLISLQQLVMLIVLLGTEGVCSQSKEGCPDSCGSVSIPYPFGTSNDCALDDSFLVTCNQSSSSPATPFLPGSTTNILNISLVGELRVATSVAHDCYSTNGSYSNYQSQILSRFPISNTRNMFTGVGCDTIAVIRNNESLHRSGQGKNFITGYGFVVEEEAYKFSIADLVYLRETTLPLVLDWAVGNQSCQVAKNDLASFACKANHSECNDSKNGGGYRCNCSFGFQGNPYLLDGCEDIDECKVSNPCTLICQNFLGGFNCSCPEGYEGDGTRNGTGCHRKVSDNKQSKVPYIIASIVSTCLLVLGMTSLYTYLSYKKRKIIKLRERYFQQNGGAFLKQMIPRNKEPNGEYQSRQEEDLKPKIFTDKELKRATKNYHQSRILGMGGFGTVYRGVLPDNTVVAIKKSNNYNSKLVKQFINEVIVISQIDHDNVVKLLGCCLETEIPILVYEYVNNRTLSYHIRDRSQESPPLSWELRLKIAVESGRALAYMHTTATSTPIVHRDVKTDNILLDENYTAKVSDFGSSALFPLGQSHLINTYLHGTYGYMDPQYMSSGILTEKSDVYSFGVVLAELLTSKKASWIEHDGRVMPLAKHFVSSMDTSGNLFQIIDRQIVNEENFEQLQQVANLVKSCLRSEIDERPTMTEVVNELERLSMGELLPSERIGGLLSSERIGGLLLSESSSSLPVIAYATNHTNFISPTGRSYSI
ncbi:Wall-associated receptor kinase [Quillaja saponaria]|uniref:Wall-associated receptor kinase n=1 Tax=Quillaja saponaria TaxID=32244 RepID=A0AAD7LZM6_QUISA|nr:Wall-associated receptor kinase [Quillaja saponaria]